MKTHLYFFSIFFSSLGLGAYNAVNMVFFLEKGLSFQAISALFMLLNIMVLVCELPTGMIADKIKPLNAVIIGLSVCLISRLLLTTDYLYSLELAMLVYGIGISFISGAANSLLLSLKRDEYSSEYLFSYQMSYRSVGIIVGGLSAYGLFRLNLNYPWLLSAMAYLCSIAILFACRQSFQMNTKMQKTPSYRDFLKSIPFLFGKPFFWASVFFSTSALAPFLLWQPFFKQFDHGLELGYLSLQIMMFCASKLARSIKLTEYKRYAVIMLNVLAMLMMPLFSDQFGILLALFLLHVFLVGLQSIFFSANFHDNVQNATRSTSESVMSATDSLISLPMFYFVGYFMDHQLSLLAFAISGLSGCLALYFFRTSRKVQKMQKEQTAG